MKKLLIIASAAPLVLLGALQTTASGTALLVGGNIYTASTSGNVITYTVRITDAGQTPLRGVSVRATEPTRGTSTVFVSTQNGFPPNATDTASAPLTGGDSLTFRPGSLSGASGNIFSGVNVGTVQPGPANSRYVSFKMAVQTPAPAPVHHPQPQPAPTSSPAPAPQPVSTAVSQPVHHRHTLNQNQPAQQNSGQAQTDITEPPVNVTVPESTPTETSEQSTTQAETTENNNSGLGAAGVGSPLSAFFVAAVGAGAMALRRSRQRLVGTILTK